MTPKQSLIFVETLDELEKQRKWIKALFILSFIFFVVAGLMYSSGDIAIAFGFPRNVLLLGIGFSIFAANKRVYYAKKFKRYIIDYAVNSYFDEVEYKPDLGLDSDSVYSTGMLRKGNVFESEDLIYGVYKDVPFSQADVRVKIRNGSEQLSRSIDIFLGRWMIFKFNKSFKCNMQVVERGFYGSKKGRFTSSGEKLKELEMDDEQFNSAFRVYCENEHEAYYILTPVMMRRMLSLMEKTKGKTMFCFVNNSLHIAFNNGRNSFEPPIFHRIDVQQIMINSFDDLKVITDFIDELKLDSSVFKV